jgi:uncharacterized membrane protein
MYFLIAWVLLSFVNSIKEIFIKHSLNKVDSKLLVWVMSLFSSLLMLPFVIREWIPELTNKFYIAFFFWWVIYFIWKFFYFEALKNWEISFISPLKWLVTVNVIFTSWLLLGEVPSFVWLMWMILAIVWVYILSIQKWHVKIIDPIKHLFTDKWSKLYLITALAYWFTVTIDKIGVLETSPFFWWFCMNMFLFFVTIPYLLKNLAKSKNFLINNYKILSWLVILHASIYIWQMYVIQNILASYTSAFKSSSALFTVIIWWIFFKEKDLKKKFFSALLIVLWIVLIIFS